MDFNTFLETATQVAPTPVATEVAPTETAPAVETPKQEPEVKPDVGKLPDSELTPEQLAKREANRKAHQDSREARMRRELRAVKEQLAQLTQSAQSKQPVDDGRPKEADYDDFSKFIIDTAKFEMRQESNAGKETKPEYTPEMIAKANRLQEVSLKTQEFIKEVPEYTSLISEYGSLLNEMPEAMETAFLEADNAPLALYALMKEGKLYDLEDMSPQRVAIEIGRAEERGKAYLQPAKTVSSAPPPMRAAKGTSSINKSISGKEALAMLKQ